MKKKKTTKELLKDISTSLSRDFHYDGIECDYDKDCSQCDVDDHHRHCQIIDFRITKLDLCRIIDSLVSLADNEIDQYCIHRILTIHSSSGKGLANKDNYEPDMQKGYYGECLDKITLSGGVQTDLLDKISSIINHKSVKEKIFAVLELEYGYIADMLKDVKDFDIERGIIKEQLIIPNKDYSRKLNTDKLEEYADHKLPIGIFMATDEMVEPRTSSIRLNKFRVIDGYHRSMAFLNSKRTNADILIARR